MDVARNYAIYRFKKDEKIDLFNAEHLVAITPLTLYKLPYDDGKRQVHLRRNRTRPFAERIEGRERKNLNSKRHDMIKALTDVTL